MTFAWADYQPATGCAKYGPAGAQALLTYLEDVFADQASYGICNCRSVRGGSAYSHHAECRAYDEGFAVFPGQDIGTKTLRLLGPHGRRLGIDHMIVNHNPGAADRGDPRIYSARSPEGRTYTGTHPHKNHNHIGLTRGAGLNLTYATLVDVVGPPGNLPTLGDSSYTDDMWQFFNINEAFVRNAYDRGWLQPKAQATLDYFLANLAELQKGAQDDVVVGFKNDWLNFRRAVSNGLILSSPVELAFDIETVEVVKSVKLPGE